MVGQTFSGLAKYYCRYGKWTVDSSDPPMLRPQMLSFCTQVYDWYNVHHRGYTRVRPKSVRSPEWEVLGPGRNRNLRHKRALGSPPVPHDHRDSNIAGKSTSQTALGLPPIPHNHRDGKLPEKIFDKRRRQLVSDFLTATLISSQSLSLLVSTRVSFECNGL